MKLGKAAAELKALMLLSPSLTLAVAESLTCGQLQAQIGAVSGASNFFLGGVTAYSLDQKARHLGVDPAIARPVNSVSPEVAEQMARGACTLFGSALGAATTGYAEPSPDNDVAIPYAWWAITVCRRGKFTRSRTGRIECPGAKRLEVQQIVAAAVMAELVAFVRELRST